MDSKWVKQRMRAMGMTQRFLAQKLQIAESTVNLKLNNRRPINVKEAAAISKWMQLSAQETVQYLFDSKVA